MRNTEFLDNYLPEDDLISELRRDENGTPYRMVKGVKVIQTEEKSQQNVDHNLICNRVRASGMSAWEYLNK